MSDIIFNLASKEDIDELISLRMDYIEADFKEYGVDKKEVIEKELPSYFERKLGNDLFAFVARENGKIIATAYLLVIEKIPNPSLPSGLDGEVLSVFTKEEYRNQGISTRLLKNLIDFAKEKKLCRIQLKATGSGYPIYNKLGFKEFGLKYKNMQLKL